VVKLKSKTVDKNAKTRSVCGGKLWYKYFGTRKLLKSCNLIEGGKRGEVVASAESDSPSSEKGKLRTALQFSFMQMVFFQINLTGSFWRHSEICLCIVIDFSQIMLGAFFKYYPFPNILIYSRIAFNIVIELEWLAWCSSAQFFSMSINCFA